MPRSLDPLLLLRLFGLLGLLLGLLFGPWLQLASWIPSRCHSLVQALTNFQTFKVKQVVAQEDGTDWEKQEQELQQHLLQPEQESEQEPGRQREARCWQVRL